jgi:hypothetical protein
VKRRKAPFVAVVVVVFLALGVGPYAAFRAFRPPRAAEAPAGSGAPVAIDDPATLQPIVLLDSNPIGDEIFSSRLMNFAILLDQLVRRGPTGDAVDELARAEKALAEPDVAGALGPRAAMALGELVSAAKDAAGKSAEDEATMTALDASTAKLDNALLAGRLPYFVDSMAYVDPEVGKRSILLYEFNIVATDLYFSEDVRVRAVRVRRLDHLNWKHTLLGFVNVHRSQAVVLLDQIDEELVNLVLPALSEGTPLPVFGPYEPVPPVDTDAVAAQGGKDVRSDAVAFSGLDQAAARELGSALSARRALFVRWNERAKALGRTLKFPPRLEVDVPALERELTGAFPRGDFDELRRIQARLGRSESMRAYETFRAAFVTSVERHEIQHRLDVMRPLPMPSRIDSLVSPGQGRAVEQLRYRIRSELSAYLAQLARDDVLPHTTLARCIRFIANPNLRGGPESYAMLVAIEGLARERGVTDVGPLLHDRALDGARIAVVHQRIAASSAEELRAAARSVWARLFGAPLAALTGPPSTIPPDRPGQSR